MGVGGGGRAVTRASSISSADRSQTSKAASKSSRLASPKLKLQTLPDTIKRAKMRVSFMKSILYHSGVYFFFFFFT